MGQCYELFFVSNPRVSAGPAGVPRFSRLEESSLTMIGITGLIGKVSDGVNALAKTVALVLTAVLISVISIGIIFRYLFNSPLSWEQEASTLLFIWVAFLGASIAFHMKAHVSITFLFDTFLKGFKVGAFLIKHIIPLIFFGIMILKGGEIVRQTASRSFQTLPISLGWLYGAMPTSGAMMLLHSLKLIGESLGKETLPKGLGEGG